MILPGAGRWQTPQAADGGDSPMARGGRRIPSTTFGGPPPRAGEEEYV